MSKALHTRRPDVNKIVEPVPARIHPRSSDWTGRTCRRYQRVYVGSVDLDGLWEWFLRKVEPEI